QSIRNRRLRALDERAVDDDGGRRLRAGGRGQEAAPGDARADGEARKIPRAPADEHPLVVRVRLALLAGYVRADAVERLDAAGEERRARGVADGEVAVEVAEAVGVAAYDAPLRFEHAAVGDELRQGVAGRAAAVERHLHQHLALHGRPRVALVGVAELGLARALAHLEHLPEAALRVRQTRTRLVGEERLERRRIGRGRI